MGYFFSWVLYLALETKKVGEPNRAALLTYPYRFCILHYILVHPSVEVNQNGNQNAPEVARKLVKKSAMLQESWPNCFT